MGEERAGESGQGRRWGRSKTGAGQQEASPRLCRWTQTRRTREWQGVLPLPIAALIMPACHRPMLPFLLPLVVLPLPFHRPWQGWSAKDRPLHIALCYGGC